MTKLPEKALLNGTKMPETTTGEFRLAMGNLRQYLADLLGEDSADREMARETLGVQEKYQAEAAGTADAVTAVFTRPVVKPLHGMRVQVRATGENTITAPTFKADETSALPIVKGNNQPLRPGDIAGEGHWLELQCDDDLKKWVLQNPAFGVSVMPTIEPVLEEKADRLELGNYLPVTGGVMSGELTMQGGTKINLNSNLAIGRGYLHKYNDTTWLVNTNSAGATSCYVSLSDNGTISLNGNILLNNNAIRHVVSASNNGTVWWRRWSDGWVEQGGNIWNGGSNQTVTLPTAFADANYMLLGDQTSPGSSHGGYFGGYYFHSRTSTSFGYVTSQEESHTNVWFACGQGA